MHAETEDTANDCNNDWYLTVSEIHVIINSTSVNKKGRKQTVGCANHKTIHFKCS